MINTILWITGVVILCHVFYTVFFPNRWKSELKNSVEGTGLEHAEDETYEDVRRGSIREWSIAASICFFLASYL